MNTDQTKEKIKVMQAWVDGRVVQFKSIGGNWHTMIQDGTEPSWDWSLLEYRIAPEPMEIEVWVNPDGSIVPSGFQLASTGCTKKKFREVL